MSLVNDALRRATEAHNRRAPAPATDLPLRPVESSPPRPADSGLGLVLPATVLTMVVVALFSFLIKRPAGGTTPTQLVAARTLPPVIQPAEPVVVAEPPLIVAIPQPLTPPTPPPAPTLHLQAVFYTPSHPSAIISGQTVHVGDTVRELQVVAIGSASALLVGVSQTNFLTLQQF